MIKSFASETTRKIFSGASLSKKERKALGSLNIDKAAVRLIALHNATEKDLLTNPSFHYHKLKDTQRFSIDANAKNSPWQITFSWENDELKDVTLVQIEDTHK